jgi:hypothetical protein
MEMTKENLLRFIERSREAQQIAKAYCIVVLQEIGHPVEFDWDSSDAPSIDSTKFDDDVTDCYIEKVWLDRGLIKVNLHAYYLGDDREDIDLADECNADYVELLDYLITKME